MRPLARIAPVAFAVWLLLSGAMAHAQEVIPEVTDADRRLLATLRPGHPRLMATDADVGLLRATIDRDPVARQWLALLRADADAMLRQPPVERRLVGPRLLAQSRLALHRIATLALVFRLTGERQYADRARAEMRAVSAFPDWNPSHFLDTAEMAHAVALGYDWLHPALPEDERDLLRSALVRLALLPAYQAHRDRLWWTTSAYNWNQVCNGGMLIAALAIADKEPDLAAYIVGRAVASLPRALASYAPDGGWAEGPGYWSYATSYTVYALAALESALGTDFGLSRSPGLDRAGHFALHFTGPAGRAFNHGNNGEMVRTTQELFWLARRFARPLYAHAARRAVRRPHPFDLLWYTAAGDGAAAAAREPLSHHNRTTETVFMRTAWEDPQAIWVAAKGGDNRANHNHLDLGTFVLEADGERWAIDLGPDNYDLPGYFGRQRLTYYRIRTLGQNTLVLDGADQDPAARARVVSFSRRGRSPFAVIDLSAAYAGQARSVRRGVALVEGRALLVQDEIDAERPPSIEWRMHTRAAVEVRGSTALLRQGGRTLHLEVLAPAGASIAAVPATAPPPENPNAGVTVVAVRPPASAGPTRIAVLMTPASRLTPPLRTAIRPLASWR
ncbi:MAG TPA: heparinase II/III family protein [Chthonomonadales bacterium]|nr:heparinase II/III family protein [Chthonomonadales bacterium]